jgi:hypothetical protein
MRLLAVKSANNTLKVRVEAVKALKGQCHEIFNFWFFS